jgi:hypothetical protein
MFRAAFRHAGAAMAAYSTSLSLEDEPLMPSLELPDDPLMPSELEELALEEPFEELDDPFVEAFRPPWPERSWELPRPEFVLPEAPRPSLRLLLSVLLPELLLPLRLAPEAP